MVYDLAMLKAFYTLYEGKIERIRTILQRPFCPSHMLIQGDGFFKVTDLLCLSLSI